MQTFSILHGSDLHIGAEPSVVNYYEVKAGQRAGLRRHLLQMTSHDPDMIEYFAWFAAEERSKGELDLVILTGDLSRTGDSDDLAAAKSFVHPRATFGWLTRDRVRRSAARLGGTWMVDRPPVPVAVMPGNHDPIGACLASPEGMNSIEYFPDIGHSRDRDARCFGSPTERLVASVWRSSE